MEINQIINLIEDLLIEHNYITVPQFGGFVVREIDFELDSENKIQPRKRIIAFNKKLRSDDGLLVTEISLRENISQKKAVKIVESFSKKLFFLLNNNQQLHFGNLGEFIVNKEGNLIFYPNETNNLDKSMFGLGAISLGKGQPISSSQEVVKEEAPVIPMHPLAHSIEKTEEEVELEEELEKNSFSYNPYWAASIAFILGCLFTFILTEPSVKTWQSSFSPLELFHFETSEVGMEMSEEGGVNNKEGGAVDALALGGGNSEAGRGKREEETEKSKDGIEMSEEIKTNPFYLIGGSFQTMEYAELGVKELKAKGFEGRILERKNDNENYRIAIDGANTLKEAEEKIGIYQAKGQSVWVLKY